MVGVTLEIQALYKRVVPFFLPLPRPTLSYGITLAPKHREKLAQYQRKLQEVHRKHGDAVGVYARLVRSASWEAVGLRTRVTVSILLGAEWDSVLLCVVSPKCGQVGEDVSGLVEDRLLDVRRACALPYVSLEFIPDGSSASNSLPAG